MAHELDFNEEGKARMFYVQSEGMPWHKLGQGVAVPLTAKEAIKTAGLDWTVSLQPITCNGQEINGHFAVQRDDTKDIFTVVKSRYTVVQNEDVFGFADSLVKDGLHYHTAGAIKQGRKVWILAKLPNQIRVIGHDVIDKYLLFSTAHDGTQSIRAMFTPVRVVCANTLQQAEIAGGFLFQSKHTSEVHNKIAKAKDLFVDLQEKEKAFTTACQRMALTNVNDEQIEAFLLDVLGYATTPRLEIPTKAVNMYENMRNLVQSGLGTDLVGVRGSVWGLYNAVTEYADHRSAIRSTTDQNDALWFGSGAKMKNNAWNKAVALLG